MDSASDPANTVAKDQTMVEHPLKHLRMWANNYCELWAEGDGVFIIGKTYTDGDPRDLFTRCPKCWPLKGDRYSGSALPGYPDHDAQVKFDSTKAYTDPEEAIEDPEDAIVTDPGDEQPEKE